MNFFSPLKRQLLTCKMYYRNREKKNSSSSCTPTHFLAILLSVYFLLSSSFYSHNQITVFTLPFFNFLVYILLVGMLCIFPTTHSREFVQNVCSEWNRGKSKVRMKTTYWKTTSENMALIKCNGLFRCCVEMKQHFSSSYHTHPYFMLKQQ